ncbi:hypothetical protein TKK_0008068 [Trichogramma kaykai]
MGRHKNVDSFYLCQSYAHVPKHLVRDNVNLLVIFRQDDVDLRHIYNDHVNTDMSYPVFKEFVVRDETERTVTETFKPIIKPINKLVTLNEEKSPHVNKKKKLEQQTVKTDQNLKVEDSENDQTLKLENIKEESSISEENTDQVTEDEEEGAAAWTPKVEDKMITDYLNLVKMQSNELDKLYGVRRENDEYHLGKSPIIIDGDKVYIGNEQYIKSKGLLELLFKKNPDPKYITNTDMTG